MEIQQHDDVVVEAAVISAGLRQAPTRERERGVTRERGAPRLGCGCPPSPPLYIGPLGGAALGDGISKGGGGQGGGVPPTPSGAPPPLGFPTLGAGGGPRGHTIPPGAGYLPHFSPWDPTG